MKGLASRIAISAALTAVAPTPAWAQKIAWQTAPSQVPASQRKITFAVPLVYGERVLGDVVVETSPYGGETRIERESLRLQLVQLLNDDGLAALDEVLMSSVILRERKWQSRRHEACSFASLTRCASWRLPKKVPLRGKNLGGYLNFKI